MHQRKPVTSRSTSVVSVAKLLEAMKKSKNSIVKLEAIHDANRLREVVEDESSLFRQRYN